MGEQRRETTGVVSTVWAFSKSTSKSMTSRLLSRVAALVASLANHGVDHTFRRKRQCLAFQAVGNWRPSSYSCRLRPVPAARDQFRHLDRAARLAKPGTRERSRSQATPAPAAHARAVRTEQRRTKEIRARVPEGFRRPRHLATRASGPRSIQTEISASRQIVPRIQTQSCVKFLYSRRKRRDRAAAPIQSASR